MSTVTFFLLAAEDEVARQRFVCKLAANHCYEQSRTHILVPNEEYLEELNQMLWEFPAERFVPHVVLSERSDTCLVTLNCADQFDGNGDTLINTTANIPQIASKFSKVCEVVLSEERPRAREQFRQYRSLKYELFHEEHDEDSDFLNPPSQSALEET